MIIVHVPDSINGRFVAGGYVLLNGSTFPLEKSPNGGYEAAVQLPQERGSRSMEVVVNFTDGSTQTFRYTADTTQEAPALTPVPGFMRLLFSLADNPEVERIAANVVTPVAMAIAIAVLLASAVATASLPAFLLYLLTFLLHPSQLIARRRRTQWGTVYDSLTKLPVDLAIVRVTDAATGRIVRSVATDRQGRYSVLVPPGSYRLTVQKAGYAFPSAHLRGKSEDVALSDLYFGDAINVQDPTKLVRNVPVDRMVVEKTPAAVQWATFGRKVQSAIAYAPVLIMVVVVCITPTVPTVIILVANALLFMAFRRLSHVPKPKSWGTVADARTGKPVGSAVARIFDTQYNKLLEMQVTDSRGRYAFLVGHNTYYVTYEKAGYAKQQRGPLTLGQDAAQPEKGKDLVGGFIAEDVRLPKADNPLPA